MTTLFVSDLHLSAERPEKLELFSAFLDKARDSASAVYVLGDLFEVWLGDDDDTPPHPQIIKALRALSDAGVALYVGHGNRDFLFGKRFCVETGAKLLDDFEIIEVDGEPTLLMHGDLLCTRDVKYQKFRRVVRNPIVRGAFLAAPLSVRRRIAQKTQSGTQASMRAKPDDIMDVDEPTVATTMLTHGVTQLIHGHTHRPGIHEFEIDGKRCRRIVLGDWYEQDSCLVFAGDDTGPQALRIAEFLA